jgi:tetratricopeptide (TPR) repeat protein
MKYSLFLGCTLLVVLANGAMAKSPHEIAEIARSTTGKLVLKLNNQELVGSGVIIHRRGDLYTLVTNRHVVCGGNLCDRLPSGASYQLEFSGNSIGSVQRYAVKESAIKLLGKDLDLAIVQFRSSRRYAVAPISIDPLKTNDGVYVAGFPLGKSEFSFNGGKAIAVVNRRLTLDGGGYSIIYSAPTLPGMSGGGVFNEKGQLVGIHGQGEKFRKNTITPWTNSTVVTGEDHWVNTKIGYNRGIPVGWLVRSLNPLGIRLNRSTVTGFMSSAMAATSADEHFIVGFNKFVEPVTEKGNSVIAGKQQALVEFNRAITLKPDYFLAYYFRGYLYSQLRAFNLALKDFDRLIALTPNVANLYFDRALVKESLQDFAGSLADYTQGIALNTEEPIGYYGRSALKAYKLNDFRGAIEDCDRAIRLNPNRDLVYMVRGYAKEQLNDLPGAEADYSQAIALNGRAAYNYLARATVRQKQNNFDNALADFDRVIALVPQDVELYLYRGNFKQFNQRDFAGALADYEQCILLAPNLAKGYSSRAFLRGTRLNDVAGALADFNRAITLDPKAVDAYVDRGLLKYEKLKDTPGALADYDRAIAIDPKLFDAYTHRGLVKYEKLGDVSGALADYERAIALNPKWFRSYNHRGLLKANKLNDRQGALADYNQSIALNPKYGRAYYNRGLLKAYSLSDRTGGIQDLQQAAKIWREDRRDAYLQQANEQLRRLGVTP